MVKLQKFCATKVNELGMYTVIVSLKPKMFCLRGQTVCNTADINRLM